MANEILTFNYARLNWDSYKKQTIPTSNECMTKADLDAYINHNSPNLSGYSSNQLVNRDKVVLQASGYTATISFNRYTTLNSITYCRVYKNEVQVASYTNSVMNQEISYASGDTIRVEVGASGSGSTTLLRRLNMDYYGDSGYTYNNITSGTYTVNQHISIYAEITDEF